MSLKKLKTLAKKYKISCFKKGTKVCVKKSTLLKRLKKSRSINKILKSATKMKSKTSKKTSKFGNKHEIPPNFPALYTPLELALGQTYGEQLRHYKAIPSSLISANFQGPASRSNGFPKGKKNEPYNFKYNSGLLGPSLPPYEAIGDPNRLKYSHKNNFGRYFH